MNVQALSDQVLLNHYLSGDQGAISKLIARHSRRVRDYINMMVKDRVVAEDIFQDTFATVWQSRRFINPDTSFSSYLYTIVRNRVLNQ